MSDHHTPSEPLAAFLADTVRHFKGTLTADGPQVWRLTNPAQQPNLLGTEGLKVTTDPEAALLDPDLSLLAAGTPLLQTLVRRIREQGLSTFNGTYRWQWPATTIKTRLQGLVPSGTKWKTQTHDELCLRAVFRVRFLREYVQEDVLRVIVDEAGQAWGGARALEADDGLLAPVAAVGLSWETLQERYQQALTAAEEALLPAILEHEAGLSRLLERENQRITAYYDEVEASGEYADGIDDPEAMAAALATLRRDRAKLLAEQRVRYQLGVHVQPVSLGLLRCQVTHVQAGKQTVRFHPLLAEPILPACAGCARRMPIARFAPEPYCSTCASLL